MKPDFRLSSAELAIAFNGHVVKIGGDTFAVFGNDECGWSIDPGDLSPEAPAGYRYQSRDELFFALVNLYVAEEGRA